MLELNALSGFSYSRFHCRMEALFSEIYILFVMAGQDPFGDKSGLS
jgi:hypothetical protein